MLELGQNLGPGTIITTYNYDAANQLNTAQQGSTTWQYTYDANGSLISDGVKTYTYDSANRLREVSDQSTVTSLSYNGLGQRLSMDAAGVIATYVMDGDRSLTAESAGNTTFYLYGLGGIGEKTTDWSYSLLDGTNTPRQLSDINGDIILSSRYTPWGDTLDTSGNGGFTYGYFGGVMDAATGLLYIGNGQYYDPATGRFLTRDVNPNNPNPYVPWNPIGAILAPLAVLSMFYSRKKNRSKWDTLIVIVLLGISMGIGIAACAPQPPAPNTNATAVPSATPAPTNPSPVEAPVSTVIAILPIATASPNETPMPTACATPIYPQPGTTLVPNSAEFRSYGIGSRFYQIFAETPGGWWDKYIDSNGGLWPIIVSMAFHWETYSLNDLIFKEAMKEAFSRKLWQSYRYYGEDGWSYFLGGRDPVRIRVDRLSAYKGNASALTLALSGVEGMNDDIAKQAYDAYGKDIWANTAWQTGLDRNRPYEFGNPTKESPKKFRSALRGDLPSCNGYCTDPNTVYYRNGVLNTSDTTEINNIVVYRLAVVLTPAQQENLCGGASCVKP